MSNEKAGSPSNNVWLSLAKSGVEYGLSEFIKPAGEKVLKSAVCWGLNTAFGLHLGEGDQKFEEKMEQTAAEIESQLEVITKELSAIENLQKEILSAIKIQTTEIDTYIADQNLKNKVVIVNDRFSQMHKIVAGQAPLSSRDPDNLIIIIDQIIATVCESENGVPGVLDLTVKQWVQQNKATNGATAMKQGYAALESTFLYYVYVVFKGLTVCVNEEIQQGGGNSKKSKTVKEWIAQEPDRISVGLNYFSTEIEKRVDHLCQQFMQVVQNLILSPYKLSVGGQLQTLPPAGVCNEILGRASLLCWLLSTTKYGTDAGDGQSYPGLHALLFLRPSQTKDGGGLSLTPFDGAKSSTGKIFDVTPRGRTYWPVVFDLVDGKGTFSKIQPYENSLAVPVFYQWALDPSSTTIGQPVGTGSDLFAQAIPQYYGPDLLPIQDQSKPQPTDVLYAFASSSSNIENQYYWGHWGWTVQQGGAPYSQNIGGDTLSIRGQASANSAAPSAWISASVPNGNPMTQLEQKADWTAAGLSFALTTHLEFANPSETIGSDDARPQFNLVYAYTTDLQGNSAHGHTHAVDLIETLELNLGTTAYQVAQWNDSGSNIDNVPAAGQSSTASGQQLHTYTLGGASYVNIGVSCSSTATNEPKVVADGGIVTGYAGITANGIELAWVQPSQSLVS